ncbi:MAG TPA: peroxiredoxin [Candidatus Thermoplasmatota archaeon]|nr:peroxiredoxin [Candidatus Thermoplasmatota archaeon]
MTLAEGAIAPDFTLPDHDGRPVRLAGLRGRRVLLTFHAEDDTPACTEQLRAFSDARAAFEAAGVRIFGISADDAATHAAFRAKARLGFPLLADRDRAVAKRYGAFGEKTLYSRKVQGTIRTTVVIGADGRVERIFRNLRVKGHAARVLEAIA